MLADLSCLSLLHNLMVFFQMQFHGSFVLKMLIAFDARVVDDNVMLGGVVLGCVSLFSMNTEPIICSKHFAAI